MECSNRQNGLQTFVEHWGFPLIAIVAAVSSSALMFFTNLNGNQWIDFFIFGQALLFSGASLIVWAKIPVYRSGHFFTFGIKSVPPSLAGYYRWGWRIFLSGVALSLCLLLPKF